MASISEDRILDFLDGRLASGDEEELLHTLAVSPERRQLLREHLRIREITNTLSGHERFAVPAHVTSNLFATLGGLGYAAPATTEAILTRAPQLVRAVAAERTIVAAKSAWRLGFSSLVSASALSFLLGAGAVYVFGSSLGITTGSHQDELTLLKSSHTANNSAHTEYSSVVAKVSPAQIPVRYASFSSSNVDVASSASRSNLAQESAVVSTTEFGSGDVSSGVPINYTTPRQRDILPASHIAGAEDIPILPDWSAAIPSPLQNEQGVISFRYGTGDASNFKSVLPSNSPRVPSASLTEVKMTWHLWKYMTARASMGLLSSYEHTPDKTPISTGLNKWAVTTSLTAAPISTVFGGELGFTLDPLGVPLETSAGLMFDGAGNQYFRGGLFFHFEPFDALSISGGIEGIMYNHDVNQSLADMHTTFQDYGKIGLAPGTAESEWVGFIGPSIELGFRF